MTIYMYIYKNWLVKHKLWLQTTGKCIWRYCWRWQRVSRKTSPAKLLDSKCIYPPTNRWICCPFCGSNLQTLYFTKRKPNRNALYVVLLIVIDCKLLDGLSGNWSFWNIWWHQMGTEWQKFLEFSITIAGIVFSIFWLVRVAWIVIL